MAFLSVVFTTFSLAGASYGDGKVFVCAQPAEDVYTYYYIQYGDSLIPLDTIQNDFRCGYVPTAFAGKRISVVVDTYGSPTRTVFPASLRIYDLNGAGAAVLMYYEHEHNEIHLSATSFGIGYLRLDVNIPKALASFDRIIGPAIIYNTDPLLHIYLRAERGSVDVSGIKITGVSDANALSAIGTSLDFAACSLHISDFSASSQSGQLFVRFRILDGNTPVYLKDVSVLVGNTLIRPQFSTDAMEYSFTTQVHLPTTVRITAPVHGCGSLSFEKQVSAAGTGVPWGVIALIVAGLIAAVAVYLSRR
ncbi:MAG: hypothetical protein GXN93_00585 [Candidatus Diapherotrites archaeon]|nr:hypothetical protein [Candidatus Diapherotrites archaeon]